MPAGNAAAGPSTCSVGEGSRLSAVGDGLPMAPCDPSAIAPLPSKAGPNALGLGPPWPPAANIPSPKTANSMTAAPGMMTFIGTLPRPEMPGPDRAPAPVAVALHPGTAVGGGGCAVLGVHQGACALPAGAGPTTDAGD